MPNEPELKQEQIKFVHLIIGGVALILSFGFGFGSAYSGRDSAINSLRMDVDKVKDRDENYWVPWKEKVDSFTATTEEQYKNILNALKRIEDSQRSYPR